jgi:glutamate--glyoxylate aminotransferase
MALNALIRGPSDAVLVPVPQYPLYSASIALYDGTFEGYELDESNGWSMDIENLQSVVDKARDAGRSVRGLVFINPGNPTGQCLTKENLQELVKFAVKNKIVLMADEVYQPNIYQDEKPFVSAKCDCRLLPIVCYVIDSASKKSRSSNCVLLDRGSWCCRACP